MKNTTLFISDCHLDPQDHKITNTFFYFIEHIAPQSDALYILGDFFETYVGDDAQDAFIPSIIRSLARLTDSGVPVYVMHGNRDFLIGQHFADKSGVSLIPDPYVVTIYDQKMVLLHGDSLCTKDLQHQWFRAFTRNRLVQKIFLSLSIPYRKKCAALLREKSIRANGYKSDVIMDVSEKTVDKMIKKYSATKMIHGHTHRPMISDKRIVLDAWHRHGNYLSIDSGGKVELVDIPF